MKRLIVLVSGITLLLGAQAQADVINHARAWASDNFGANPPYTIDNWGELEASAAVDNTAPDLTRSRQASSSAHLEEHAGRLLLQLGATSRVFSSVAVMQEKATARGYWYDTLRVEPKPGYPMPTQVLVTMELTGSMKVDNTINGLATGKVVFNGDAGATVKLSGYNPLTNPIFTGSWLTQDYSLVSGTTNLSMDFTGTLVRTVDLVDGVASLSIMLESESSILQINNNPKEVGSDFGETLTITMINDADGNWPEQWTYRTDSGMVPEPATCVQLAGLALLGLIGYGWNRRRHRP
jgi:hypothetical protein